MSLTRGQKKAIALAITPIVLIILGVLAPQVALFAIAGLCTLIVVSGLGWLWAYEIQEAWHS